MHKECNFVEVWDIEEVFCFFWHDLHLDADTVFLNDLLSWIHDHCDFLLYALHEQIFLGKWCILSEVRLELILGDEREEFIS